MAGMLDPSQLSPDDLSNMGWLAQAQPEGYGWLSGAIAPDIDTLKEQAAAQLAAKMRQQSPTVPPAGGDTFNDRFQGFAPPNGTTAPPLPPPQTIKPAPQPIDVGDSTIPQNATLTSGQMPPGASPVAPPTAPSAPAAPPTSTGPSLLDRLGAGFSDFGAGGRAGGLIGALSGAAQGMSTGQRLDPFGAQNQTVQAFVSRGMPTDLARMAASNPAVLQQILPRIMGVKQQTFTQIGEDMFGNKKYGFVDPVSGAVTPFQGSTPLGGAGAGQTGFGPNTVGGTGQIDSSLKGNDYLAQFPPEIQSAVKAYVAGESMPTGNPRAGYVQAIKTIAQKYGADQGIEVDDNTYAARHKAVTGLASTTPGSLGGQMTYARTSLNHLGDVADAAVNLDNSNGLGIAPLATVINSARGLTTDQAGKVGALADAAGHYGQEVTKYYAGSPGGESEREQFQTSLGGTKSPTQLADVLEQELNLATGKISKTQSTIDEALGPGSKYQVMRPDEQKDVARVQAAIAKLRGISSPTQGAQASTQPSGMPQTPADALAQARDAIAKGANRTQVILRLQQNGINTSGL